MINSLTSNNSIRPTTVGVVDLHATNMAATVICESCLAFLLFNSFGRLAPKIGLPLTSNFLIEYSPEYLNVPSTLVLVNTGSTIIQAVDDEEGGSGLVSQRIWGP